MAQKYQFINAARVKRLIKDTHPGVRVSGEFLMALDGLVRNKIQWSATLPMNKRTIKHIL